MKVRPVETEERPALVGAADEWAEVEEGGAVVKPQLRQDSDVAKDVQ